MIRSRSMLFMEDIEFLILFDGFDFNHSRKETYNVVPKFELKDAVLVCIIVFLKTSLFWKKESDFESLYSRFDMICLNFSIPNGLPSGAFS